MEHSPTDQNTLLAEGASTAGGGITADEAAVRTASAVRLARVVVIEVADEHDGGEKQRETKRA